MIGTNLIWPRGRRDIGFVSRLIRIIKLYKAIYEARQLQKKKEAGHQLDAISSHSARIKTAFLFESSMLPVRCCGCWKIAGDGKASDHGDAPLPWK